MSYLKVLNVFVLSVSLVGLTSCGGGGSKSGDGGYTPPVVSSSQSVVASSGSSEATASSLVSSSDSSLSSDSSQTSISSSSLESSASLASSSSVGSSLASSVETSSSVSSSLLSSSSSSFSSASASTIAPAFVAGGIGGSGAFDSIGTAARFNNPNAVAVDVSGNIFVADKDNHTVRKIAVDGTVTTLAGLAGVPGSVNGTGSAARFNSPSAIALDSSGNLYVGDTKNFTIRKITSAGVVSTFAGTAGTSGSSSNTFTKITSITVDTSGNLFITDGHAIRKVNSSGSASPVKGSVSTAGNSNATGSERFDSPTGIALDTDGNLYIADTGNNLIRKISTTLAVTNYAGSGSAGHVDSSLVNAKFDEPTSIVYVAGNFYVTEKGNQDIRKITSSGVTTLAGTAGTAGMIDATGAAAKFNNPLGIASDSSGNLFIADQSNQLIRKVTSAGVVTTVAGSYPLTGSDNGVGNAARFGSLNLSDLIADTAGNLYLSDTANHTIRKITSTGVVSTLTGTATTSGSTDGTLANAKFNQPRGLAIDASGNIFVADSQNHTIRKITSTNVITVAGSAGQSGLTNATSTNARFDEPSLLAIDSTGNLFIVDQSGNAIRKMKSTGEVSLLAGGTSSSGPVDGNSSTAQFGTITGITVGSDGNLYVTDSGTVRKVIVAVGSTGTVTTIAGVASQYDHQDGTGTAARFGITGGIKSDSNGNLYVADLGNHVIRKVTTAGVVNTVVGQPHLGTFLQSAAPNAIAQPKALALFGASLYFAFDNAIGLVTPLP